MGKVKSWNGNCTLSSSCTYKPEALKINRNLFDEVSMKYLWSIGGVSMKYGSNWKKNSNSVKLERRGVSLAIIWQDKLTFVTRWTVIPSI